MLFVVKFLHLLPGDSGQIGTAIFPESPRSNLKFALSNLQMIILEQLLGGQCIFQTTFYKDSSYFCLIKAKQHEIVRTCKFSGSQ